MEYTPEGVSEPVKIDKQKKKYQYVSHYKDLTSQRFGMLTALAKVPNANAKQAVWHCRCDCGNECDVKKRSWNEALYRTVVVSQISDLQNPI